MLHQDSMLFSLIEKERARQKSTITLIASENFVSAQVLEAAGSVFTNKYAEGYPNRRYYGGCEVMDEVETLAIERAKQLFNVEWANVQPHSGSQANAAVFLACVKPYDKILGLNLAHGGHLTHGHPVSFSGRLYNATFYGVDKDTGYIDMDEVARQARKERPKVIICGASAYSRDWDYARFREIADEVGALLWADIAHVAGFIAHGLLNNPFPYCHVVTTTTQKILRGTRGGLIMLGKDFDNPFGHVDANARPLKMSTLLDKCVFPGIQGGPLGHVIAAKAVTLHEALSDQYKTYVKQVIANARVLANALIDKGYPILTNGTDNHMLLVDLTHTNVTGAQAEIALQHASIITNRNLLPFDKRSASVTSGLRLGLAAVTTRGFVEKDVLQLAEWIDYILQDVDNTAHIKQVQQEVTRYMEHFPLTTMDIE